MSRINTYTRNLFSNSDEEKDILYAIATDNIENSKKYINITNVNNIIDKKNGYTALHYAIKTGNKDLIHYLLTLKANTKMKTNDGMDAFDLSMRFQNKALYEFIIREQTDKISVLEENYSVLSTKNKQVETRNRYLLKTIDTNGQKMNDLKTDLFSLKNTNLALKTENADLKSKNSEISAELTELKDSNNKLKRKYDELDQSYDGLLDNIRKKQK